MGSAAMPTKKIIFRPNVSWAFSFDRTMSLSSELREWWKAFVELIDDERKGYRKSRSWFWFLVILAFLYGLFAILGRTH